MTRSATHIERRNERPIRLRGSLRQQIAGTTCMLVLGLAVVAPGGCAAPPSPSAAGGQLESLTVVPRPREDGTYRRAYFGQTWADTDGSHCRQRADVLYRDVDRSRTFTTRRSGRCAHEMVAGTWKDPYTGEVQHLH